VTAGGDAGTTNPFGTRVFLLLFVDGRDRVATARLSGWRGRRRRLGASLMSTSPGAGTRVLVRKCKRPLPGTNAPRPVAEWDARGWTPGLTYAALSRFLLLSAGGRWV